MTSLYKICIGFLLMTTFFNTSNNTEETNLETFKKAKVDYEAYEKIVKEVKNHRVERLVNLKEFTELSKKKEVVILDTRSRRRYENKHIKGAIHLNFSEFTQENLKRLIPNPDTTVLIYCNNNFEEDQINFATKVVIPKLVQKNIKPYTMALNIPTYINLYAYGYRNVYELSEMVNAFSGNIAFDGYKNQY